MLIGIKQNLTRAISVFMETSSRFPERGEGSKGTSLDFCRLRNRSTTAECRVIL